MLTIGARLPTNQYVRIVKNVLNLDKHETLVLQGFRSEGMAKLAQVVNVLSTWGYISVVRIKTKSDPGLKIVVKKSADFQKNFDEFAAQLQQRRDERDRLRAEKQAEDDEAAAATTATKEVDSKEGESKEGDDDSKPDSDKAADADSDAQAEPSSEAAAAESSSAPAQEVVEQTKA